VRDEERIVEIEAIDAPVHVAWDLGVSDDTALWFYQTVGAQIFILDCYSSSGVGVEHYADVIVERGQRYGWQHGTDYVPHDAKIKEWGSGRTRVETMQRINLHPDLVPLATVADGINAVRRVLPLCVFHPRCETGIQAMEQYHREWNDDTKSYRMPRRSTTGPRTTRTVFATSRRRGAARCAPLPNLSYRAAKASSFRRRPNPAKG
jgi:phage terminase large subunit